MVPVVPSRSWSQPHLNANNAQPSLLGLSMRMCEPETATENVWHVLDVIEGSPAESAGLVPMGDWILGKYLAFYQAYLVACSKATFVQRTGWSGGVLSAENDFYDLVEAVSLIYPRFGERISNLASYVISTSTSRCAFTSIRTTSSKFEHIRGPGTCQ